MDLSKLGATDAQFGDEEDEKDSSKIHVRMQQRNGRKCITTVQGLADDLDIKVSVFSYNWENVLNLNTFTLIYYNYDYIFNFLKIMINFYREYLKL